MMNLLRLSMLLVIVATGPACAPALKIGGRAPDFSARDGKGRAVGLDAFAGRVVVLYFWKIPTVWISLSDSNEDIPTVHRRADELYEHYREDRRVEVLGVHGSDWGDPQQYFFEHEINLPTVRDGEAIVTAYRVNEFPTFIIVGIHKEILYFQEGFNDGDEHRMIRVVDQHLFAESIPER